ncbi:Presequence translocated-associated motor subunit PAM17, mitochondrial [Choanephora cucurbitarum]|uniref:Presequence translocated-associated motor subunit PAM17 n=1 Tax=Choanephora cucurbitarum TaxID=101091 RepID=A0A1C7MXB6_9FUNG|nr:Presequence translocated-associated motor subunit PAM17, mitochondrial [Choanephora cucurbitarum]
MALSPLKTQLLKRPFLATQVRLASQTSVEGQDLLPTWNDYFKLRKKRRAYEVAAYLPSTTGPLVGAFGYFAQMEVDPYTKILGLDPLMGAILCTGAAGFVGFLMSPSVGNVFFKLFNRKYLRVMDQRDKAFYEHIKQNRAPARFNSIRSPIPDYYGEKINSVQGYRNWLRKQREHIRKGTFGGNVNDNPDLL